MSDKPRLCIGLVHLGAVINCTIAIAAGGYGCYKLKGYIDDELVKRKFDREQERNQGTLQPKHGSGKFIVASSQNAFVTYGSGGPFVTVGGRLNGNSVKLETPEELGVFNQWYYYTGANGVPYWEHNVKNDLPDADGNYGKHFEVLQDEYVWMMQWKFRRQQDNK